jgi:O-antigen/teichoic acid export membrane protein
MTKLAAHLSTFSQWALAQSRDRVVRNLGWYGLAEMGVRLSRLITTIILARLLLPEDFGIIAIALTAFELVRVLANNGVGLTIVRAAQAELERTCATAFRVAIGVSVAMMAILCMVGIVLSTVSGRSDLLPMMAVLSLSFAFLPFTEINYCRLLRGQQMKTIAGITAAQVLFDNVLTAILALSGWHVWAVVLPKLLTAPFYAYLLRRSEPWRPSLAVETLPLKPLFTFAVPILGSELLTALRFNLDKILVGTILGVKALGIYAFAFNAGLGLSMTFTAALSASLFPHFAELAHDRDGLIARFEQALKSSVLVVVLLILAQSFAAIFYVPVIFGEKWAFAAPLVAMLCASGLARPLFDASSQILRARGETHIDFAASMAFTVTLLGTFALVLPLGIEMAIGAFASVSMVGHVAMLLFVRWWIARRDVSPTQEAAA